jgi:hypothetical protein
MGRKGDSGRREGERGGEKDIEEGRYGVFESVKGRDMEKNRGVRERE